MGLNFDSINYGVCKQSKNVCLNTNQPLCQNLDELLTFMTLYPEYVCNVDVAQCAHNLSKFHFINLKYLNFCKNTVDKKFFYKQSRQQKIQTLSSICGRETTCLSADVLTIKQSIGLLALSFALKENALRKTDIIKQIQPILSYFYNNWYDDVGLYIDFNSLTDEQINEYFESVYMPFVESVHNDFAILKKIFFTICMVCYNNDKKSRIKDERHKCSTADLYKSLKTFGKLTYKELLEYDNSEYFEAVNFFINNNTSLLNIYYDEEAQFGLDFAFFIYFITIC